MLKNQTISKPTPLLLFKGYKQIRQLTENICKPLEIEDYVVQPVVDVSPPKWHLAHTTWFFETFILIPFDPGYKEFHPSYSYIFNSYYNHVGERVLRHDRGNLSRPSVKDIYAYRKYVDHSMGRFIENNNESLSQECIDVLELGLQHEQQHQELLWTDIKYILGTNPLYPKYADELPWEEELIDQSKNHMIHVPEGNYSIGFNGNGFCFDNELDRHQVFLNDYRISNQLVTNGEYLEFIEDGGYQRFEFWLDEGWAWINSNEIKAPFYWKKKDDDWFNYTLKGLEKLNLAQALNHVSYHEAFAFAQWKGMRLPTEAEWEVANDQFNWGARWEITQSAYQAYPGFKTKEGAIGEYNGKFMVNQMTFRGSSLLTSPGHSRPSYRNFFHPHLQWQFTGIRLAL